MKPEIALRRPSPDIRPSHGLWSLWEMHEFQIRPLIEVLDVLVNVCGMVSSKHPKIWPKVSSGAREDIARHVQNIIPQLQQAELALCVKGAERLLKILAQTDSSDLIVIEAHDLRKRLLDQADSTFCLLLSPQEKRLFELPVPFGKEVEQKFPSANEDIYEAHKCLALGRSTACVMHLMRACEVALQAFAGTMGVERQADWGGYLRKITEEVEKRVKQSGKRSNDEQFYAEAAIGFEHLKRAWRNPTMHVDKTYSPERAREILDAVRSFMADLATRVSEQQKPS